MDNYLIDRETLEQFIDELMKQKPLPANTPEELNNLRESSIQSLDDEISLAIFGSLDKTQLVELNRLLDSGEESPDAFQDFFQKAGINLEETIKGAMQKYSQEFLGGQNE